MTAAWVGLAPPKSSPSLLHLPSEAAASGPKLGARFPCGFRLGLFREVPWQGAVGRRRERLRSLALFRPVGLTQAGPVLLPKVTALARWLAF